MKSGLSYPATVGVVTLAALMWGLYWVPLHWLKASGLDGITAAFALTLGGLPVILWGLATRRVALTARQLLGAVSIGVAISLYGTALNYTDVTRVVLLFYLSPAWSILIECRWFGRSWDKLTLIALSLFAMGLVTIINPAALNVTAINPGDIMALVAGIAWSAGAGIVFSSDAPKPLGLAIAAAGFSILVTGAVLWFDPGSTAWESVNWHWVVPIVVLGACLYVLPVTVATFYGAINLTPATLTFLLSAEVLSGIASSSYWLAEPFTVAKAVGTVCILAAVFVEVTRYKSLAAQPIE